MKRNTKQVASGLIFALALASLGGCAGSTRVPPSASQAAPVIAGKVVETMDAGGYTYICLEKNGEKIWVAAPTMKVTVGEELELLSGAEMGPFTSKNLDRTFDKIIFSGGAVAKAATQPSAMPPGHPPLPGVAAPSSSVPPDDKATMAEKPFYSGKVVHTMDASGYTYILLEKDGKKSWGAVPGTEVKVGDEIELKPGTEMGNFKSKTLNRSFDNIIFSAGIVPKK